MKGKMGGRTVFIIQETVVRGKLDLVKIVVKNGTEEETFKGTVID